MSSYHRTTLKCPISQLRPELRQALQDYFKARGLDGPETLACYETTSARKNAGRLALWLNDQPDTITQVAILLTPERLIWARWGDRSGTRVTAAQMKDIQVKVFASIIAHESGLEVGGNMEGAKSRMRGYIGMQSATIAQECCEEIRQAIDKVNPPGNKKNLWWLGR